MDVKDYYAVLGLARAADTDEIKKAYRKLARKYHPDVSKETDADARMKEVNEAYAVLGDSEKRTAYDDFSSRPQRAHGFQMPPGWDPDAGPQADADASGDYFSSLFCKTAHGRQSGRARRAQWRGADLHARIVVSLNEAYAGVTRALTLHGSHQDSGGDLVADERTLDVRIPKGVRDGQRLRLTGQGAPGHGDGEPGDLYLEVHFAPHPGYRIEGRDVHARTPVTPWEVALGAGIEVDTPSGKVQVTVPPASQTGRKLRLKGRGIPGMNPEDAPGDLYLVLEVVVPAPHGDRQRALYDSMASEMAFNPRTSAGATA